MFQPKIMSKSHVLAKSHVDITCFSKRSCQNHIVQPKVMSKSHCLAKGHVEITCFSLKSCQNHIFQPKYIHIYIYIYISICTSIHSCIHSLIHLSTYISIYTCSKLNKYMHSDSYACYNEGSAITTTITTILPFDSDGWKSGIPTLPCCVLRAAS